MLWILGPRATFPLRFGSILHQFPERIPYIEIEFQNAFYRIKLTQRIKRKLWQILHKKIHYNLVYFYSEKLFNTRKSPQQLSSRK